MRGMKRLAFVLAAAALLLPGAARAAACSPLSCAPSQFSLGPHLIGYRTQVTAKVHVADVGTGRHLFTLPNGLVFGHTLLHQGRTLQWWDATTGKLRASIHVPWTMRLVGASTDGSRAVGIQGNSVMIGPANFSQWRRVPLPAGNWDFDALHGRKLFLIKYLKAGGYQVWLVDLSNDSTPMKLLKDPHASGTIWGVPFSRLASPDGRYLFTVYLASNGATMVHELDLVAGTTRCIDLPGTGNYNNGITWGLSLAPDHRTLWAVSPGYGKVVAIDIRTRKVLEQFGVQLPYWNVNNATRSAVSPDGTEIAFLNGENTAIVDVRSRRLVRQGKSRAIAVAWSGGRVVTLG